MVSKKQGFQHRRWVKASSGWCWGENPADSEGRLFWWEREDRGTRRWSPEKNALIDDLMCAHSERRATLWRKV